MLIKGYLRVGGLVDETLTWQTQVDTTVKRFLRLLGFLSEFVTLYPAKNNKNLRSCYTKRISTTVVKPENAWVNQCLSDRLQNYETDKAGGILLVQALDVGLLRF